MILGFSRGRNIIYLNNRWVWADTKELVKIERSCIRCGRMPTKEGYDACLGYIPGVISACCGHGVEKKYIIKK